MKQEIIPSLALNWRAADRQDDDKDDDDDDDDDDC